jgi:hypothetical protein
MFGASMNAAATTFRGFTGTAHPLTAVAAAPVLYEVGRRRPDVSSHIEDNLAAIVSRFTQRVEHQILITPSRAALDAMRSNTSRPGSSMVRRIRH